MLFHRVRILSGTAASGSTQFGLTEYSSCSSNSQDIILTSRCTLFSPPRPGSGSSNYINAVCIRSSNYQITVRYSLSSNNPFLLLLAGLCSPNYQIAVHYSSNSFFFKSHWRVCAVRTTKLQFVYVVRTTKLQCKCRN